MMNTMFSRQQITHPLLACVIAATGVLIPCGQPVVAAAEPLPKTVQFNRDIRPILSNYCFHCHGPDEMHRQAELRLDDEQSAFAVRDGVAAVVPGDLEKSELWHRVTTDDELTIMPPPETKKELSEREIALLKSWIEQGAPWQGHWAFLPPKRPAVPQVKAADVVQNPIDAFILRKVHEAGLTPSPEAEREVLIRRVTLDLTGLPPTPEEVAAFVNDSSPNAYEKVVDRLLASPHYGERMALAWMDLARYGDTSVYHADGPREMWAWRDWVIKSYNNNKPFNQFTVEQLAGDLLPNSTVDQQIATAFHRNHGTTDEGGVIPEEYRVEYVVDRTNTTSSVWMGLTMECSQCHDHKYDPISQREYYQFYAFFNQAADPGMQTRNGNQSPTVPVPNEAAASEVAALKSEITAKENRIAEHLKQLEPKFLAWQQAAQPTSDSEGPADVLAHFPLDEQEGQQVADPTAADLTATLHGKPAWQDGRVGGSLAFDGSQHVQAGDRANFERDEKFSYGCWVWLENNSAGALISRMNDGNAYRGWDLYLTNKRLSAHIIHSWPGDAIKVTTKKSLEPGKWHHVFMTYDGSSQAKGVKLYINGKEEAWDIEQNGLKNTIRSNVELRLGARTPGSQFRGKLDDVRIYHRELSAAEVAALAGADPIAPILRLPVAERTPEQLETLRQHYLTTQDETYPKLRQEIDKAKARVAQLAKPLSTVMVLQDVKQPRMTYVLNRGQYDQPLKDQPVEPGVPRVFGEWPSEAPRNRLGLAEWLTRPDHPLMARVAVNRYWMMLFGRGLVETAEDFGSQGSWPTHPALLDWLAVEFVESGWDVKRMLKTMVMSHTYRQSSRLTPEYQEADPENLLLARSPRFRLQGEFIRDTALSVSGLLVPQVGGPGVKPYQPPGLWNEVSLSGNVRFVQDHGEKLYRRSMYTYWKRSAPAPSMLIFDVPTREKCTVRRPTTNTPLQALVVLNDPQYVEAARVMAQRVIGEAGPTPAERIRRAFRLATSREASDRVVNILTKAYEAELASFEAEPERAEKLLKVGEHPRDEKIPPAEHAAWTIVCSMILNLDETLTRS